MSDKIGDATSKIGDATSKIGDIVQGKLSFKEVTQQSWVIILVVIAMIVLVLVVVYIMQMIKKTRLQNIVLQSSMIAMDNRTVVPFSVPAGNMSLVSNGQEYSYSFWIFMGSAYASTTQPKIILQRGNTNTYTSNGLIQISSSTSPLIMLDKASNKMYFAVSTSAVGATSLSPTDIIKQTSAGDYTSGYLVTYIDYVPLQRWVNIALVIKNTAIYVYMDADLYSVASVASAHSGLSGSTTNPMIAGTSGDLTLGDSRYSTPGFLSLARFYNYALGQSDLQALYSSGPVPQSWLSYIGLGQYGVRNPVYEVV
jgi:hypothetical protein